MAQSGQLVMSAICPRSGANRKTFARSELLRFSTASRCNGDRFARVAGATPGHLRNPKKDRTLLRVPGGFSERIWRMSPIRCRALLALPLLLALTGAGLGQPATMAWPEAVAQLTSARTRAENCVAFLKRYGDKEQVTRGQLTYANAKADSDAVIAGLITALFARQEPASLSSLQARLGNGVSGLADICNAVSKLVPSTAGEKGLLAVALPVAIPPLLKLLSDSLSAL